MNTFETPGYHTPGQQPNNQILPENMASSILQTPHPAIIDSQEFNVFYEPETKIYLTKTCIIFTALILCPIMSLLMISGIANYAFVVIIALLFLVCFGVIDFFWSLQELETLWTDSEDAYKPFEILTIATALLILYLKLERVFPTSLFAFAPLIVFSLVYLFSSKASRKTKVQATLFRAYYTVQILLISCKIDHHLNWNWKYILCLTMAYLGVSAVSRMSFMISLYHKLNVSNNFQNSNAYDLHKKLGFCWYLGCCSLPLLAILGLYGFAQAYDSTKDFKLLKAIAYISIFFNISLLVLTILTRKSLIKFIIFFRLIKSLRATFEASIRIKPKKTISLQVEKKEQSFKMISPTYFVPLEKYLNEKVSKIKELLNSYKLREFTPVHSSIEINESDERIWVIENDVEDIEKNPIDNEDQNLCYICYKNTPDTIMVPCGHGGVCYDCAVAAIKHKDECTQCRNKVEAIYRLDLTCKTLNIVKGIELSRVVTKYS